MRRFSDLTAHPGWNVLRNGYRFAAKLDNRDRLYPGHDISI